MNPSCGHNGWAIVGPGSIDADNPVNYHVIEVKIIRDENEVVTSVIRDKKAKTLCTRLTVKDGSQKSFLSTEDENEIRDRLALMQKNGQEVCGVCASRFYADKDCRVQG